MPTDTKVCSFDCIYCECGWTPGKRAGIAVLAARSEVRLKMEEKLREMTASREFPDVITFAGNGEPTLHPEFEEIIDDTIELRNKLCPEARIAVLSNATMLHKKSVVSALLKVDENIQKLDSGIEETVRKIDCPSSAFSLNKVVENLTQFKGKVIIQTLFLRGKHKNEIIDNTTAEELQAWLKLLVEINPSRVMIYAIDRDTPAEGLEKVPVEELQLIATRVRNAGFEVQVSG